MPRSSVNVLRDGGLGDAPVQKREHPGFQATRYRVGWELGSQRLGASVFEVEPGQAAYPLHYHLGEEELLLVLDGTPSTRGLDGEWQSLSPGDLVSYPRGEDGAHQIANFGETTVRILVVSTNGDPDIILYPESGKVGAAQRLSTSTGLLTFHRLVDAVEYHEGENPPSPPP